MIPSKILVYHHPLSNTNTEAHAPSRRRRKSLGDLFHKGYRVKSGPAVPEKEEPENLWQSLVPCCRVCASWGKIPPNHSFFSKCSIFPEVAWERRAVPRAGFGEVCSGEMVALSLLFLWHAHGTRMCWVRQKSCFFFLDKFHWPLVLLNVIELLKNALRKHWGWFGK
jgi:hypothetical protein